MAEQWDTWLAGVRAAQKGGVRLPQLQIDRGHAYSKVLAFEADYEADAFAASLANAPDSTPFLNFTVVVGAFGSGVTPVTLSLTALQTAAIPADTDIDGNEDFVFDILRTPNGGTQGRLMAGVIPVSGKVT